LLFPTLHSSSLLSGPDASSVPRESQRFLRACLAVALLLVAPMALSQETQSHEAQMRAQSSSPEDDARQLLGRCADSLDDESIGLEALEDECPGLEEAIERLGFMPLLSDKQRDQLDLNSLKELRALSYRYGGRAGNNSPGLDSLDSVLDEIKQQRAEQPLTLLQRFKRWLRSLWERQQASGDPWFTQWLSEHQLSSAVRQGLLIAVTVLIVLLALAVLINELRASGVLRKRQAAAAEGTGFFDSALAASAGPMDLDAAAPGERPSLLLRMLVATLVKTGRLRTERSLTHRELGVRARFDDPQQRECFERVAELAERVVYGHARLPREDLDSIVQAGRALNSSLNDKLSGAPA
jgi:hypothetical protein